MNKRSGGDPWGILGMGLGVLAELLAGPWGLWGIPWGPLQSSGTVPWVSLESLKDGLFVGGDSIIIVAGSAEVAWCCSSSGWWGHGRRVWAPS